MTVPGLQSTRHCLMLPNPTKTLKIHRTGPHAGRWV